MNSKVLEIRNELLNQWTEVEQIIDRMITTKLSEVSYWKFASDEYYTHLPYFHEINKACRKEKIKGVLLVKEGNVRSPDFVELT
ncbi:hypothetical protein [Lysinibacillus sp. FSL K6-3209]|uniref:hypothetical protein n=1 Tax=Lysinibacillus sp. FSL K6-3209 TaxID=2921497 RepID=UPI0030DD0751